jgi:hypothetical protein
VPFNFLRRGKDQGAEEAQAAQATVTPARSGQRVAFDGLSEEWHLVGFMEIDGRLSDALNRREAIAITDMQWAPIDGSAPFEPAPGLKGIDPYDLIVVLAGESTLPPLSDEEKVAHKVHKVGYDVALEVPPFRVIGTVFLHPGSEPDRLMDRSTEMFIPVTDAVALLGEQQINDPTIDVILVNRFYLRGVTQVDKRTRTRVVPLPGQPLGGTTWTDKAR